MKWKIYGTDTVFKDDLGKSALVKCYYDLRNIADTSLRRFSLMQKLTNKN